MKERAVKIGYMKLISNGMKYRSDKVKKSLFGTQACSKAKKLLRHRTDSEKHTTKKPIEQVKNKGMKSNKLKNVNKTIKGEIWKIRVWNVRELTSKEQELLTFDGLAGVLIF